MEGRAGTVDENAVTAGHSNNGVMPGGAWLCQHQRRADEGCVRPQQVDGKQVEKERTPHAVERQRQQYDRGRLDLAVTTACRQKIQPGYGGRHPRYRRVGQKIDGRNQERKRDVRSGSSRFWVALEEQTKDGVPAQIVERAFAHQRGQQSIDSPHHRRGWHPEQLVGEQYARQPNEKLTPTDRGSSCFTKRGMSYRCTT